MKGSERTHARVSTRFSGREQGMKIIIWPGAMAERRCQGRRRERRGFVICKAGSIAGACVPFRALWHVSSRMPEVFDQLSCSSSSGYSGRKERVCVCACAAAGERV